MTPQEQNLKKLEEILKLLDAGVTKEEFLKSFENVVAIVLKIEKRNTDAVKKIEETYQNLLQKFQNDHTMTLAELKSQVNSVFVGDRLTEIKKELDARMSSIEGRIEKKLSSVKDGKTPTKNELVGLIKPLIPAPIPGSPDDPDEVVGKINRAGIQIKKSKIEGLEEELKLFGNTKNNLTLVGGGRGIQLYVGGTKKGMIKTINLIAGTNISISYALSYGRNDITISSSATALQKLSATGMVNGTNVDFAFTSKPTLVISDGASYQENKGWTWNAGTLTATLSIPPSYDVYGLG